MRILIADDHDLVRDAICTYLALDARLKVRAVHDQPTALEMIESEGAFDLTVLDFCMPGMDGLNGLVEVIGRNAGRPVALMSGTADRQVAEDAIALGAAGFLPKTLSARTMLNAVCFMAAGECFAPISFLRADDIEVHQFEALLSRREKQVLRGLARGLPNKEIARGLELCEATVKLHVKTLCRKLRARNRTHAAMIARDSGYI